MKRLLAASLLVLPAWLQAAPDGGHLPARQLTVEWRWIERDEAPPAEAGRSGAVIVGTALTVDARPGPAWHTPAAAPVAVQRLSVMNGEQALLQSTQWRPLQALTLLRNAKEGDTAALQTTWLQAVDSLSVRPRWPGGPQPVTVQLWAQGSAAADAEGAAPAAQRQLASTVRLPLGQWVTVARSGLGSGGAEAGSVSTQDLARSHSSELQLRISAP